MGTEPSATPPKRAEEPVTAPPFVGSMLYYGLTILVWVWLVGLLLAMGISIGVLTNAIDDDVSGASVFELVADSR